MVLGFRNIWDRLLTNGLNTDDDLDNSFGVIIVQRTAGILNLNGLH